MALDKQLVKDMIAKRLKVPIDTVTEDALFNDDLGADSVDTVDLVMDFESFFGIDIPENVSENLKKVSDLIEYLDSLPIDR